MPDPATYVAAAKLCFRHQLSRPKLYLRLSVLVCVAAAIGATISLATGTDAFAAIMLGLVGAVGGLAFVAIILGGSYLLLPRNNRRLFYQDKSIATETRFCWDDQHTRWQSAAGSYDVQWDKHHDWSANGDVMIFFANERLYRFVPAHAMSADQRSEIVERLEAVRRGA